ncbi:NAD-dependent epimerase/dehydratase family protein [Streptomyces sp. NPDC058067]|uniref:NAD-dependent epimerase/dehydratase family protein n=1 Tax=Streptomyces sp. NPDC058067 TaxID=3346324 RepID=UPI0036EC45BA
MSTTYLVTGGAGVIGSHLADALLAAGHRAVILDDLSTGDRARLADAWPSPRLRFVRGSALDERLVGELLSRCDGAVHAALSVDVRVLADAAHRLGRPLLSVEGEGAGGAEGSGGAVGPSVTGVRIFGEVVGPRRVPAYGTVLGGFAARAVAGEVVGVAEAAEVVEVASDGGPRRRFTHVTDVVDALVRLLAAGGAAGRVLDLAGTEGVTDAELAALVARRADTGAPPGPTSPPDPTSLPDTATALSELTGWVPRFTLDRLVDAALAEACRVASSLVPGRRAEELAPVQPLS